MITTTYTSDIQTNRYEQIAYTHTILQYVAKCKEPNRNDKHTLLQNNTKSSNLLMELNEQRKRKKQTTK